MFLWFGPHLLCVLRFCAISPPSCLLCVSATMLHHLLLALSLDADGGLMDFLLFSPIQHLLSYLRFQSSTAVCTANFIEICLESCSYIYRSLGSLGSCHNSGGGEGRGERKFCFSQLKMNSFPRSSVFTYKERSPGRISSPEMSESCGEHPARS